MAERVPLPPLQAGLNPYPPAGNQQEFRSGTYVVQIPKDQIYRVPPPENAYIANKYQNNPRRSQKKRWCCSCCCLLWLIVFIIVTVILAGAFVGILYLVVKSDIPRFSIEHVAENSKALSQFQVNLKGENGNSKLVLRYLNGGVVGLEHLGSKIGTGKWPEFEQGSGNSKVFRLVTKGSDAVIKQLKKKHGNKSLTLVLRAQVPIRFEWKGIKSWVMSMDVRCDFKVDKLGVNSRVLSEECDAKLKL
ncbi:hypothetical protein AMTRI_Chr04g188590 [Amborella trichopoda]|uniref:Late embryogenesis abundant protein LEA-2 subgroup domain-containing protein n=1 Tax=Amborella trichopoda TaxID=13333 RepID=W1NG78_AMBTC|nr:NDR1/HIN1-like protein 13 [Amborella trichopoda]ERM94184.1 hypothetical protein AMTR_s00010p00185810 [Amborella trichopoda]|eukprot:XP_006826947.1 NDR1/HIN1-like protein 13 [Amborella trichopoda]